MADDDYTLLGVRPDGGIPVVDLVAAVGEAAVVRRARAFLSEHASCARVEIWRGGELVRQVSRETPDVGAGAGAAPLA